MVDLMLEHGWSVKDTQAAVERVKSVVAARPAWVKSPLPVARIAIEPSFAKTVLASLATLASCHERLPESVTLYRLNDTDETKEINGHGAPQALTPIQPPLAQVSRPATERALLRLGRVEHNHPSKVLPASRTARVIRTPRPH